MFPIVELIRKYPEMEADKAGDLYLYDDEMTIVSGGRVLISEYFNNTVVDIAEKWNDPTVSHQIVFKDGATYVEIEHGGDWHKALIEIKQNTL